MLGASTKGRRTDGAFGRVLLVALDGLRATDPDRWAVAASNVLAAIRPEGAESVYLLTFSPSSPVWSVNAVWPAAAPAVSLHDDRRLLSPPSSDEGLPVQARTGSTLTPGRIWFIPGPGAYAVLATGRSVGAEVDDLRRLAMRTLADVHQRIQATAHQARTQAALDHTEAVNRSLTNGQATTRRALVDTQARLERAVEATDDGLWDWNVGDGRMWWSPRTAALLALPAEAPPTRHAVARRIHRDDRTRLARAVLAHLRSNTPFDIQLRVVGRDDDVRWARVRGRVITTDRTGRVMAGSIREITEQRRLDQQRRQSQRLESLGLLAGGVAHDFNNLLMAIINFSRFAKDDLPVDPEEAQNSLREVLGAAERAAGLTRQLLSFSRREAAQRRPFDLNGLVANLVKMLRRLIQENIMLDFEPGQAIGLVLADPGQIEQVLVNLSVNARDAMPDGGRLCITTEAVVLDGRALAGAAAKLCGPYVRLSVTDTGVGMDGAVRQRAFEPFFTTKAEGQGTGLGLSTVYGIAKQNDGVVTLDSQPGAGTTVALYLPQVDPLVSPSAPPPRADSRGDKERILVAEDDPMVRKVLQKLLLRAGYEVAVAVDGLQALERFSQSPDGFDLVFADAVMPGLSGRQLYERVTMVRPNMPFLFGSGYTAGEFGGDFFRSNGHDLVAKPYDVDVLLSKIRKLLGRARCATRKA